MAPGAEGIAVPVGWFVAMHLQKSLRMQTLRIVWAREK